jgi:riboflavin kinase/FMN adenylyltransferase
VASIGNFDGVHLGHRAILDSAIVDGQRRNLPTFLITFEPHPLSVVAPSRSPRLLQTRRQKLDSLERAGLSDLLIIHFDVELAALGGEAFFADVICPRLELAAIHVGESFRFGNRRAGDLTLLRRIGEKHGFNVVGIPSLLIDGEPVSSSTTRRALRAGDVELARRLLGRPFSLSGEVIPGEGRGADLEFPTANLRLENELIPSNGVYVTETVVLAGRYPSMTNVGVRPTFGGDSVTVESHLLEFSGDLYGERAEVRFRARIRDEKRFPDARELADQLARDRAAATAYFANMQFQTT